LHNYCKPQTEQGVLLLTVSLISEKANLTRHKKGIFIMLDSFPLHGISPKKKALGEIKTFITRWGNKIYYYYYCQCSLQKIPLK